MCSCAAELVGSIDFPDDVGEYSAARDDQKFVFPGKYDESSAQPLEVARLFL